MTRHLTAAIVTAALVGCATDPSARFAEGPPQCRHFASQSEAQEFYERHYEHWLTLDPKRTGRACAEMTEARR